MSRVTDKAKEILEHLNGTIPDPVDRLRKLHEMRMDADVKAAIGRSLYASMLDNASTLEGDVSGLTGIHVSCDRRTLTGLLATMDDIHSPEWRLESVMDGTILDKRADVPTWTIRIITCGRDLESAHTIGDLILMNAILSQPNIDMNQPFDRWSVDI